MTAPVLATRARVLDDPATRKAVIDGLTKGLSVASSAAIVGLSREAVRLYRKDHPDFHEACMVAVSKFESRMLDRVVAATDDDDGAKHAQWLLERRLPQYWSLRTEIRQVADSEDDARDDSRELSTEDLSRIASEGT